MGTILVVDDMATNRELIGKVLSGTGHTLVYAENGDQAIQRAKELKPSLILMDVVMPGLNGFNACRLLKQDDTTKAIPIVLVTSKGTDSDKFWGKKQGADDHVVKPFNPNDLLEVVRRHVR